MLHQLRIIDFAIMDHLEMDFPAGLVIFTGETGAGKSILLDAIQAVTGGKADATMVRTGSDKAKLEAVFEYSPDQTELYEILAREELLEDPSQILIEREIRLEGRNTARVNGHMVSQAVLREIGGQLVDIHGQSDHLSLLNPRSHLPLLDRYAANDAENQAYRSLYREYMDVRKELEELIQSENEQHSRLELLQFQRDEIQSAHLSVEEEGELERERTRLANAENLAGLCQTILTLLEEASPETSSTIDLLGEVSRQLRSLEKVDQTQAPLVDQVDSLLIGAQDLATGVRAYSEEIEFNPQRLTEVEDRLELIHRLTRKYGGDVASTLEYARRNQAALEKISHAADRIVELQEQERELYVRLSETARELTLTRQAAATSLAGAIEDELTQLSMSGARFRVDLNPLRTEDGAPRFSSAGSDRVEFMIAPNPGEGFKPLEKIASGGETSRFMLALKNVLARQDQIPTLVFDEIDQGIGGRVGMVIGRKLRELASCHQVFCVTHLPQLAAYAATHYRVTKHISQNRTSTQVTLLAGEERVLELAAMLGATSASNQQSAREMLSQFQSEFPASS